MGKEHDGRGVEKRLPLQTEWSQTAGVKSGLDKRLRKFWLDCFYRLRKFGFLWIMPTCNITSILESILHIEPSLREYTPFSKLDLFIACLRLKSII